MTMDLNTAALIETLARAASCIGSTPASGKINQLIVDLLPTTTGDEDIADALRQDNAALQDELKVLRDKLKKISSGATEMLGNVTGTGEDAVALRGDLNKIIELSDDVGA